MQTHVHNYVLHSIILMSYHSLLYTFQNLFVTTTHCTSILILTSLTVMPASLSALFCSKCCSFKFCCTRAVLCFVLLGLGLCCTEAGGCWMGDTGTSTPRQYCVCTEADFHFPLLPPPLLLHRQLSLFCLFCWNQQ